MNFRFFLICRNCGKTAHKDFNKSNEELNNMIRIAKRALFLPQFILCPNCLEIKTVEIEIHKKEA